jgi:hypothetical protein
MTEINKERYQILLNRTCNKGKHRFRTNWFGVSWCVICGQLSSSLADELKEEDKLKIVDD